MSRKTRITGRWLKLRRNLLNVFILVLLVAVLSGCSSLGSGSRVPSPELEYQWSEPFEAVMHDGETRWVQCITVNDAKNIDAYIEIKNVTEEVSQ